ncbi:MAG: nucleotidyltransferase domain-containing protein [Steroidobacteraceae bacterium]
MQQSLSAVLFPVYRRSVLSLLLLAPDEALHGREIARRTGLPSGTVIRELNRLTDVGLLKREKRGNQSLYSADRTCLVFEEVAGILRKTSGAAHVIAGALTPLSGRIETAFIYGSFAKGTAKAGSDIDVMIVGAVSLGAVIDILHPVQAQVGREINPKVFSSREWSAKLKAKSAFAMELLANPRIVLVGDKDESEKPRRRKSGHDRSIQRNRSKTHRTARSALPPRRR